MIEKLFGNKVIGFKQSCKAIERDEGKILYIALDSNEKMITSIKEIAENHSVDIVYVDTMKKLGIMCDIDVKASVALILK
ncbi:MAG: ribosomal L7Ae/L30e/S12e/Gadd45 family protein [Sarcina sp.]